MSIVFQLNRKGKKKEGKNWLMTLTAQPLGHGKNLSLSLDPDFQDAPFLATCSS